MSDRRKHVDFELLAALVVLATLATGFAGRGCGHHVNANLNVDPSAANGPND